MSRLLHTFTLTMSQALDLHAAACASMAGLTQTLNDTNLSRGIEGALRDEMTKRRDHLHETIKALGRQVDAISNNQTKGQTN